MSTVFLAMLACLVSVSLGNSVERIGAHRRPHNPALANSQDHNLFIPLPMVRNVRMQPDDHGHFMMDVETADGARRTEVGNMDDDGNNEVKGVIKYILPDGTPFVLRYIADETGFHPQGNMLPTPPPMPAHSMLQMKKAGMLHDSLEDDGMFDSMENDPMFKSMEDMFRSLEDDLIDDSLEISTLKHIHPVSGQVANHPVTGQVGNHRVTGRVANHPGTGQVVRFDSIEDRFDSIESIENRRVLTRNRGNVRGFLKNRANRRGVLLRNRKTGNIVLYRNGKIIDSIENDGFRSLEDNTFEDLSLEDNTLEHLSLEDNTLENETLEDITFEDISLENRTDEINSFENNSKESLEFIVRLNQPVSSGRRRFLSRG